MNNFAPVLIPTLNRHVHFKRCIKSLSKCTHSDKIDLFIALDYPLNETHLEGYKYTEEYLPQIKGFKSVNIIKRNTNYGAQKNAVNLIEMVLDKYDRMIFSEDDNEFAPNFLDYINKGLNKFENDPNVMAICGYNYPIIIPQKYSHNHYYCKAFSAWGYGSWRHKPINYVCTPDEMKVLLRDISYIKESLKYYHLTNLYTLLTAHDKPRYGDGAITINLLKNNKYCVFPTISKVRNYGRDGSGVHKSIAKKDIYKNQIIDKNEIFFFTEGVPTTDENIIRSIRKYFSLTTMSKMKNYFLHLIYKLNDIFNLKK